MPNEVTIIIKAGPNGVSISHPEDPVICFGLLEIAKIQIAKKLEPPKDGERPRIIELPPGTRVRGG